MLSIGVVARGLIGPGAGGAAAERPEFKGSSLVGNDPNLWRTGETFGTGELVSKMVIAVLLVAGFGAAAIYVSRKFLPRIANLPGKEIRILETVHLGARKTVHLVKIGQQRFLIGSTNENITMLANVTDAVCETDLSAEESRHFPNINGR